MKVLIIGGAGFIGSNLAEYHCEKNDEVIIFDNLVRAGTDLNLQWLKQKFTKIRFLKADISRDVEILERVVSENIDIIYLLAAQVAVTASVKNPRYDFEVNLAGAINVLEAARKANSRAAIFYSSTNKVYGDMCDEPLVEEADKYAYKTLMLGVSEKYPLDFHSPYGCSKGAADQYFLDYSRIFGLNTVVFRQSCIYGDRQFGVADQGWISWFTIASVTGKKITIFGDGKQVRDVLYVKDLVNAFEAAYKRLPITRGQAYNIGGGVNNSVSLLQTIKIIEKVRNVKMTFTFDKFRPGDQKIYISNIAKAQRDFDWVPEIRPEEGIKKLNHWVQQNIQLFKD